MVLSYFESKNKPLLILDNLSYKVLNLKIRENLTADMFINTPGIYKINRFNKLIKIDEVPEKFSELLKIIKKET